MTENQEGDVESSLVKYSITFYGQLEHHRLPMINEPRACYVDIMLYNKSGRRGVVVIPVYGPINIGEKYKVDITIEKIEYGEFLIGVRNQLGKKVIKDE